MKYLDLAQRLEDLDSRIARNDKESSTVSARINSLENQIESAKKKQRALRTARLTLLDEKETTTREFKARLG
jgi:predicted  nucleic acid-binding Zn-ribbon protein